MPFWLVLLIQETIPEILKIFFCTIICIDKTSMCICHVYFQFYRADSYEFVLRICLKLWQFYRANAYSSYPYWMQLDFITDFHISPRNSPIPYRCRSRLPSLIGFAIQYSLHLPIRLSAPLDMASLLRTPYQLSDSIVAIESWHDNLVRL